MTVLPETGFVQVLIPLVTSVLAFASAQSAAAARTKQSAINLATAREYRDAARAQAWAQLTGQPAPREIPSWALIAAAGGAAWLLWSVTRGD